jgi:hypothetical protein
MLLGAIVGAWSAPACPQQAAVLDIDAGLLALPLRDRHRAQARGPRHHHRRHRGRRDLCARVLVGSSGATLQGSPLSGGYAGARRMLLLMAKYANGVAEQKGLGIRFQAIVPQQMIGGTGVGDAGASADARAMGLEPAAFLARLGRCRPASSVTTWSRCWTIRTTLRASPSA